jgi:fibronectin type 3 domain-containing protein
MNTKKHFTLFILLLFSAGIYAQTDTVAVAVRANVKKDMIQLRWAATSSSAWYYTNKNGVTIERYTLIRDGQTLAEPEKKILTTQPLKPHPLDDWQQIANADSYAAVIAQALYGESFEVSGGTRNIAEIIALSQEQQQRYAMALYAADMSYQAAMFAGWAFDDSDVKKGERYLYRIIPAGSDANRRIETGSAFTGLDDYRELPQPVELDAIFGNSTVMLTWNYELLENFYNLYFVERSEDGRNFYRLTKSPLTNITGTSRMFRVDSIENEKTYYYRVAGITPFGDTSPYSDTVYGQGHLMLIYVPHIIKAIPDDRGIFDVLWDFDVRGNVLLSHFELQRSDTGNGEYVTVISDIPPEKRNILYRDPQPENYLRIAAVPKIGETAYSFPFLLQIPDSIPPAVPQGLQGYVDTVGTVHIKWNANTDEDILGYRIFRGQTAGEEFVPLTDIAVKDTFFIDTVNVYNLNPKVYYAVSALDRRYNQSALCRAAEITKPVLIQPAPPFITKAEAAENGIKLEWVTGIDESLSSYVIYRGTDKADSILAEITDANVKTFVDAAAVGGTLYRYAVAAKNTGNRQSALSPEITVKARFMEDAKAAIKKFTGKRTDRGIVLQWQHTIANVRSISIYRKTQDAQFTLWREAGADTAEMIDEQANARATYEYLLVIKDQNGKPKSAEVKVKSL